MGNAIAAAVMRAQDLQLAAALVRTGNSLLGSKFAEDGPVISDTLTSAHNIDVIIDFTLPAGVMSHLQYARPMVIGTTGFSDQQLDKLHDFSKHTPLLHAPNMSIGINWCYKLLADTDRFLNPSWQVQINDVHHVHKKDTPSGTAKQLAEVLKQRQPVITSDRHGEIIGEHQVAFANDFEEIVITHRAKDRGIFVQGALVATRWLVNQSPGLYSMQDLVA